jgi:anaerobic selenocysteine-containing dehydrogenase
MNRIDLGALQPRVPEMLRTPSGKVELAPTMLLADLPRALAEIDTGPAPLVVIGRRDVRTNNSWMHNLPTLAKGPERCTLLVHPADAASHHLTDGDWARLESEAGTIVVPVAVTAAESVDRLRTWASGRCLCSFQPGVYHRGGQSPSVRGRKVTRASAN